MRLCGISSRFQLLSPCTRQVTHALLTRPPLSHLSFRRSQGASFDLHVLGTPPAFILSQDQTLMLKFVSVVKTCWSKTSVYCYFWVGPLRTMFFEYILLRIFKDSCYCSVINVHLTSSFKKLEALRVLGISYFYSFSYISYMHCIMLINC